MPTKTHSRYVVTEDGKPYAERPFGTEGAARGEVYLDVTPELAADFLAHSKGGRRIRDEYVTELAREMRPRDGQPAEYSAMIRGKAFKFDTDGYLRDGHHTAFAVIEAAKDEVRPDGTVIPGVASVPCGVVWGLTEAEVGQLDRNVRRTYADALAVKRVPNPGETAPLVRAAISWDAGYQADRTHYQPTPAELDARLRKDGELFARALELARPVLAQIGHRGIYSPSALRFHMYLLARLEKESPAAGQLVVKWVNALTYDTEPWVTRNVLAPLTDARAAMTRKAPFRRYGPQLALLIEGWNRWSTGDMRHKIALATLIEKITGKDEFPVPRAPRAGRAGFTRLPGGNDHDGNHRQGRGRQHAAAAQALVREPGQGRA